MRKSLAKVLMGFAGALLAVACQESQLKSGFASLENNPQSCTAPVVLNFASVQPIFSQRCLRCHDAGSRFSMASYGDLFAIRDRIQVVLESDRMPLDGPLPSAQKQLVMAWLKAGAPEQSDQSLACSSETPGPEAGETGPISLSYQGLKSTFLSAKCLACHRTGGSAARYDFSNYGTLVSLRIFDLEEPEDSKIVEVVLKEGRGQMPPIRSNIPRLTEAEVDFLIEWIRAGLPE